jgi:ribosomal protein S6--L-glutamate ligase
MIVSFHPLFEADKNIICAGRNPDKSDLAAIRAADAVVLPQGCRQNLYEMARQHCDFVFPNYDARFRYPEKIGQIRLFRATNTPYPETRAFDDMASFRREFGAKPQRLPFAWPFVFKLNWGGEGDTVYLIDSFEALQVRLQQVDIFEKSGQKGFLIQEFIPNRNKTLRVVRIGRQYIVYWRVLKNQTGFLANLSKGATIDFDSDPDLQKSAITIIEALCKKTGINLAGFDAIFSAEQNDRQPLLLEINYFFGRKGLGGSRAYYKILQSEIQQWLNSLGLSQISFSG